MRNPRRTATTAAALMIGVGLVATISIFAASATASINRIIDDAIVGDIIVDSGTFGFGGLSPDLAERLNELPEVEAASGIRVGFADIDEEPQIVYGVDPSTIGRIVDSGVTSGSIESMGADDMAVFDEYAAEHGWSLGDTVEVVFAETGTRLMTVAAIYEHDEFAGNVFVGNAAFEANFPNVFDFQVFVLGADGSTTADTKAAVEAVAADYANADVQDLTEYKQGQADQINQLLSFVYALLFLAIIIALIGIANTLALSVIERTHELGLLRAVGMTRRQLRASIRWESVLIALLGTALGGVIGVFFGWALVEALRDEGFSELRIPIGQVLTAVALAVLAGVIAATLPARRAARMNVLGAVAAE